MFFFGLFLLVVGVLLFVVLRMVDKGMSKVFTPSGKPIKSAPAKLSAVFLVLGIALFVCFTAVCSIASVDTGHTGILKTFGKVEDTTLDSGLHFKLPWQELVEMDNRVQKANLQLDVFSSDIQEVKCNYTLNYQISKKNAQEIYRTIGEDYFNTVITPNISECVKTQTARYSADELVAKRDELAEKIETSLTAELLRYNIEVVGTSIENLDFNDAFTDAVEAKQVAAQNKLRATTEQEQKNMEAQAAAERAKIDANAQAEVAKIQAEADLAVQKINADAAEYAGQKEAAKNNAINASLTGDLLKYYLIQQWDGKYPDTYMGSDNVAAIVDIPVGSSGN